MTVVVAGRVVDRLRRAAHAAAPLEACGLLFGPPGPDLRIDEATIDGSSTEDTFCLRPEALLAHAADPRWIGVWHSHPRGPARLSSADRRTAAAWPRLLHLLVTPDGLSCFASQRDAFAPLPWRRSGEREQDRVLRSAAP